MTRPIPVANFGTLTVLLEALQEEHADGTIDAQEVFSAEIPERICTGELDIGLALAPPPVDGVGSELLRREAVSALLSTRLIDRQFLSSGVGTSLGRLPDARHSVVPRHGKGSGPLRRRRFVVPGAGPGRRDRTASGTAWQGDPS
ncbi:hypothetical protein [Promicromonospora sp. NPDC090134]|uniref:hypothetical protein n=1 Tax=Promicromonospora sp. NPDC090134 TaxID=3364408 RepID=UPI00380A2D25